MNFATIQKVCPYLGVSYKFVWKIAKVLNQFIWATEYWLKTLNCQTVWKNTKKFF